MKVVRVHWSHWRISASHDIYLFCEARFLDKNKCKKARNSIKSGYRVTTSKTNVFEYVGFLCQKLPHQKFDLFLALTFSWKTSTGIYEIQNTGFLSKTKFGSSVLVFLKKPCIFLVSWWSCNTQFNKSRNLRVTPNVFEPAFSHCKNVNHGQRGFPKVTLALFE